MKKIIFILIAVSLFHGFATAQWLQQSSGVSSALLDVHFINQNTGWACGDGGVIVKTTNSGLNWIQSTSGTTNNLWSIFPVDSDLLYSVGWFQTILKSTNGGTNWIPIRNGTTNDVPSFLRCYFLNASTGWLLRTGGWILRTTNGGASFDSSQVNIGFPYDIYFKDALTGVLCGGGAFVAKSTDGGVSWGQFTLPLFQFQAPNLYRLSFIGNNGWTIGEGGTVNMGRLVYRTTDFGNTWDSIGRVPYPLNELNYSVFFTNTNTGYAGGTTGYIFKSTNGGFNWIQQTVPIDGFRRGFSFINDSLGWVVGGGGYILKTTNGGTYVGITEVGNFAPDNYKLYQNYPNPFNSNTNIRFQMVKQGLLKITLFDVLGNKVGSIADKKLMSGEYEIMFSANDLSSGIYFYRMTVDGNIIGSRKLILVK